MFNWIADSQAIIKVDWRNIHPNQNISAVWGQYSSWSCIIIVIENCAQNALACQTGRDVKLWSWLALELQGGVVVGSCSGMDGCCPPIQCRLNLSWRHSHANLNLFAHELQSCPKVNETANLIRCFLWYGRVARMKVARRRPEMLCRACTHWLLCFCYGLWCLVLISLRTIEDFQIFWGAQGSN